MCLFCKLYRYKLWDMNANTLPPPPPPRIRSVRPPITFYIGAKLLTQISPLPRNNEKKKIGIRFFKGISACSSN